MPLSSVKINDSPSNGVLATNRSVNRVLELAPAYWQQTLEQQEAQQKLAANVFRQVALGEIDEHSQTR